MKLINSTENLITNYTASKLTRLIRGAVAAGMCLIAAMSVLAQTSETSPATQPAGQASATAEAERVIVTGSNIPTAEEVGPNPVYDLNRDLIQKSGQGNTVEDLLKTQPVMGANSVPVQNNGTGQGGPTGTSSISLRGFDPAATFVLICRFSKRFFLSAVL